MKLTRAVLVLAICAGFVLAGLWIHDLPRVDPVKKFIACYIGGVFFSLLGLAVVIRMVLRVPSLVIDADGLILPNFLVGSYRLHWNEVSGFGVVELKRNRMLGIKLADPAKTLRRLGMQLRVIAWFNTIICGYPFAVPQSTLPVSLDQVIQGVALFSHLSSTRTRPGGFADGGPVV